MMSKALEGGVINKKKTEKLNFWDSNFNEKPRNYSAFVEIIWKVIDLQS